MIFRLPLDYVGPSTFRYRITNDRCPNLWSEAFVRINIQDTSSTRAIEELELPTAFSPNGDGINDNFVIRDLNPSDLNHLYIVNRWGDVVYNKKHYENQWKGKHRDSANDLPIGTYYVLFKRKLIGPHRYTGTVTLVR